MAFWTFTLAMDLLIPLMMIGFGRLFLTRPPRKINALFGYRTSMSMKNQDTWEFAHRYCGRLWLRWGLILLPLSVLPLFFVGGQDAAAVEMVGQVVAAVQLIPLIGSIFPTEAALKRTFDQNGVRRQAGNPGPL